MTTASPERDDRTIERERAGQQLRAAAQLTAARLDDHIGDLRQLLGTLSHVLSADGGSPDRNDAILRSIKPKLPIADRAYFQTALQARDLVAEGFADRIPCEVRKEREPERQTPRGHGLRMARIDRPRNGVAGELVPQRSAALR